MSYGIFNSVAFSLASGLAVAPNATVTVLNESDGSAATLFADVNGANAKANVFQADSSGRFSFYAAGRALGYRVTVESGSESVTLRNVPVGTAMYLDVGDFVDITALTAHTGNVSNPHAVTKTQVGLSNVDNVQQQPIDGTLTAFAALTIAANSLTIGTGADAFSQTTFAAGTFPGRSSSGNLVAKTISDDAFAFLAAANNAAMRTALSAQTLDATLTAFAALTIAANSLTIGTGADAFSQTTFAANTFPGRSSSGNLVAKTITDLGFALLDDADDATMRRTINVGTVDQNSQSGAYTTVLADNGKHILHPTADNNPRTFTIPANASVAYPIGATITFVNEINTVTIAITSDTLVLAGDGSTGSRTLAANGIATAIKIGTTRWLISGTGLT